MSVQSLDLPLDQIGSLCRKYRVKELALFGSRVRGQSTSDSDLDFLVTFQPDAQIGFMALARLSRELSEVTNREVDLVPKAGLKEAIRDEVLESAEVVFEARWTLPEGHRQRRGLN